ncbi:hypothetical protein [Amycolatopsis sp. cmx-8-4]|uniref:hypothetical protein n=1 Tax=Amycolatopsis sp. cmx-8-4 TaxID=2790947 RepID=UPI00397E5063
MHQPWARRLGLILLTLLVLLCGGTTAVPAQAETNPNYWLTPAYAGSEMHVPVLMYRHRHTASQELLKLKPDVTWARNVAAFEYYTPGHIRLVIVGPSLPQNIPTHPDTVPFDIYREVNGAWILVDSNGDPLEAQGKPVDWRTPGPASVVWKPRSDQDPEIQAAVKAGRHSEWTTSLYLLHKLMGANATSRRGLSERIPCQSGANNCRLNLRTETEGLYPGLEVMEYITDLLGTDQAAKDLQATQRAWESVGMPTHSNAEQLLGWRLLVPPGSPAPSGAASSALAPGADPGGIDFSTLELRYLKEGGGQLEYAFNATAAAGDKHDVAEGQLAAAQSSDAFFVWLSMRESTFWVNLNPNEPDRIVDPTLGITDVGRIMLEADFRMKKVVGRLIQPDTDLGRRFWGEPGTTAARCIDMRQWIVPKPASVYEQDGGLYIVDAPLDVKMETEYLQQKGQPTGCASPDAAMADRFRTLVLPKVVEDVNQGPEFAELRRIYLSRVAASWYRDRHSRDGALAGMIDSGNVAAWPALRDWSPRQVFDQYVDSYNKKEFDVSRRVKVGNTEYQVTYTHGGVDLTGIQLNQLSPSQFQRDHADLPEMMQRSLSRQVTGPHDKVWLGAVGHPVPLPDLNRPDSPTSDPLFVAFVAAPVAVWLVIGVWSLLRRRRKVNRG